MNILTDEEIANNHKPYGIHGINGFDHVIAFARAIESAVLSKLAEQSGEPVGMFWTNGKGEWEQDTPERRIKGLTHPLYTEAQLLAVQLRTAEACAKAAYKQAVARGGYNTIADDVRDATVSDWREYL